LLLDLLFAAASETILQLGRDPKRIGALVGLTCVVHTWGRNLIFHPTKASSRQGRCMRFTGLKTAWLTLGC
jgi:hypothetical protein